MTYNILNGGESRERLILKVIRMAQPDVVILQEVFTEEFLKFLADELKMSYFIGKGNSRRKVALLSKIPVRAFRSLHPRFPIWRNFIEAEVEYLPDQRARIFGVHPIAMLGIVFEIWRFFEAKYIARHIKDFQDGPCLVAGDFNAIALGDKVKVENMPRWLKQMIYLQGNRVYHFSLKVFLAAGFTDCFRQLNIDGGFTLPPPEPNSRLDYIFVNDKMKPYLRKCWVVREPEDVNFASDHYPVVAEFGF